MRQRPRDSVLLAVGSSSVWGGTLGQGLTGQVGETGWVAVPERTQVCFSAKGGPGALVFSGRGRGPGGLGAGWEVWMGQPSGPQFSSLAAPADHVA